MCYVFDAGARADSRTAGESEMTAAVPWQEIALLVVAGAAFVLILSNRVRPDLVALLVLISLALGKVLTPSQALAGFSNPAVVTIGGLFVITAALERTGVVRFLADRLARPARHSENRALALFMGTGAALSLVMNNIAAGAVLLPTAVGVARRSGLRESRLLMPIGFGTLLGGMATIFTTANLILSGCLEAQGQRALRMIDFLPAGGVVAVAGIAYMVLLGRRYLPDRESLARAALARADLSATYQLAERLWEARIEATSPLVGKRLEDCTIGARLGVTVLAVWHGREARMPPDPGERLGAHDILLVLGREERVRQLELEGTTIGRNSNPQGLDLHGLPVVLTEVVIPPRSPAIGHTLKELRLRRKFGLTTVALWRGGRSYRTDVGDFELQAGDALLMVGSAAQVRLLAEEPGYIVLTQQAPEPVPTRRAAWAALVTIAAIALAAGGFLPTAEAMLAGAAGLVLTGCLSMEDAYRAIDWKALLLVAGMLPLGTAMVSTGLAAALTQHLSTALASLGPLGVIAVLWACAVGLTQVVSGQVAALVLGPVAVSAALQLQVNPIAVGVAVAMGCSAAFLTPIAHPVNVLMMGPGAYEPRDFLRAGAGLLVVCFLALLVAMPLFFRLAG